MTEWLDKLNLQPHEKRVVVVVMAVLFLVANYLFIWPRLGGADAIISKTSEATRLAALYSAHEAEIPAVTNRIARLKQSGEEVLRADQSSLFLSTLQTEAAKSGLNIMQTRNLGSGSANQTNEFLEERAIMINFATGDSNLVDFMYALSQPASVLRIQSFDLGPEAPAQTRLAGSMTLIGSIEKVPKAKANSSATNSPAAKTGPQNSAAKTSTKAAAAPTDKTKSTTPLLPGAKPSSIATNSISKKK